MEVIYATGRPGQLEFYTTDKRADVPADAITFAICTEAAVVENTDEDVFNAITDQEYFTVQEMIYEARRREAAHVLAEQRARQFTLELPVKDFFRWLTGSQSIRLNCNPVVNPTRGVAS